MSHITHDQHCEILATKPVLQMSRFRIATLLIALGKKISNERGSLFISQNKLIRGNRWGQRQGSTRPLIRKGTGAYARPSCIKLAPAIVANGEISGVFSISAEER